MQRIIIDFNAVTYAPVYAGEIGESRAVRLHLIPPDYMSSDESIVRYNVAFKIAAGVVLSELFGKDDEINIDLGAPLTDDNQLVMQLIGMSSDGETAISKTPLLQLIIGDSIDGEIIPDPVTGKTIYTEILELEEKISEIEVKELYDAETGKPAYTVTEIDEMYAAGNLLTWKGRPVIAVYANTQWNRFLYFPRESAGRNVLIYKQSVQNGSVIGDEESIGGFSDINFTLNLFNKLYAIEAGAQKNVQTDYTEADSSKDSFLKNKPTKLSDFTNDVGYLTETTYTEIYDTANSQSFYTGTEIKTMFENNIPLVYTLANGIKYFVYAVEGSSAITLQLWTVVNSVGGSTGWAGKATIPASTKAISDVTIYTKTVLSSDISKFTGGSVSQGNTSFVSGGQVYDALQGGSSLPVATSDKDVIYWDGTNQTYVAGAITNVIPDGDNLSY